MKLPTRLLPAAFLFAVIARPLGAADEPKKDEPKKDEPKKVEPKKPAAKKPEKPKPEIFTDVDKAGLEYKFQGEYVGESPDLGKLGAQVVAAGDGKFEVYLLGGGLPGAGWDGKPWMKGTGTMSSAETTPASVAVEGKDFRGTLNADGTFAGAMGKDSKFSLARTVRRSPTEGAKPPTGAVVLFDGSNADDWKGGKLVEADGAKFLLAGTGSKKLFTDFHLHVEFRTVFSPKTPRGNRSNSGVFCDEFYEIQILDSFGLEKPGKHDGGAMYTYHPPTVNMCFPPLTWQTYDVDFTAARFADGKKTANARVTVLHNGVKIHDDVEYPSGTNGRPDAKKPAPILLQDHGSPVWFRNIWIVEKKSE